MPVSVLAGATVHFAKGFEKRTRHKGSNGGNSSGRGFGTPSPSSPLRPSASEDLLIPGESREAMKMAKSFRGKVVPCTKCNGTGKRVCKFCQGSTRMVGFLGNRVPCVPCEATGVLDYPCATCKGDGFLMP